MGSGSAARGGPRADQAVIVPRYSAPLRIGGASPRPPAKSRVARLLEEAFGPTTGVEEVLDPRMEMKSGGSGVDDGSGVGLEAPLSAAAVPHGYDEQDLGSLYSVPPAPLAPPRRRAQ